MKLPLVYYDNPILRKRAEEITQITDEIRQLASDMIETMDESNGIGLAAPQVGRLVRLFVLRNYIDKEDGHVGLSDPEVFINPKITILGDEKVLEEEGCLSIPGIHGHVLRPVRIKIEATDLNGNPITQEIDTFKSRVILHENDHLNGVLFIDRMEKEARKSLEPQLLELKKKLHKE